MLLALAMQVSVPHGSVGTIGITVAGDVATSAQHPFAVSSGPTTPRRAGGLPPGACERLLHVHRCRRRVLAEWPAWVDPGRVVAPCSAPGCERPWSHQRAATTSPRRVARRDRDRHGVRQVPGLPRCPCSARSGEGAAAPGLRGATTLYLSPTKALAADQLARVEALAVPGLRAATYDGDTATDERRWVRDHASFVLTNPDLLHHSLLPGHERWARFLRALRVRGGRRVPPLPRRLRLARGRGAAPAAAGGARATAPTPTFVLASATVSDAGRRTRHA